MNVEKIKSTKCPVNTAEHAVWGQLISEGWTVFRRGWPDFICFRSVGDNQEVLIVEVKPEHWHKLKKEQLVVMRWLQLLGAHVMRGDGKGTLIPFEEKKEMDKVDESEAYVTHKKLSKILKRVLR